jgi:hypothetical protein
MSPKGGNIAGQIGATKTGKNLSPYELGQKDTVRFSQAGQVTG